MTTLLRTLALSTGLALLAGPALAQEDAVVARVGDREITERDLTAATNEIGPQFGRLPEEQRRLAILSALIDINVLAQEAEGTDLADDPAVRSQIEFQTDLALHNAYFEREGVDQVTEEQLRARYEQEIGAMEPVTEYNARHILLESREDAEAVIAELEGGADFATLAQERSVGPTSANGGDLGFFRAGQMVPAFEAAVMELEPGERAAEPVETQFGWHVIELVEEREAERPAFEDVREEVQQAVLQERYRQLVQEARSQLSVEYVDPELRTQVEQIESQMAGEGAGAAGEGGEASGQSGSAQ